MKTAYYVVSDGIYFAFWNRGCWDCTETFDPKCLLDDTDAQSVKRQFNAQRYLGDDGDVSKPEWHVFQSWLEVNVHPVDEG